MSYGLQVRNATDILILDNFNRLTRLIGVFGFSIPPGTSSTIYITGIVDDGTWGIAITVSSAGINYPSLALNTGNVTITLPSHYGAVTVTGHLIVFRL